MKICLLLKVLPNSSKNEIVGWKEDELKIKLTATPEKGEANLFLIDFLSKQWKINKSQFEIISGKTSRHKRVEIEFRDLKIPEILNERF